MSEHEVLKSSWPDMRAGRTPCECPEVWSRTWRVDAIVPTFNANEDLRLLVEGLDGLDLRGVELRVTIVDNASDPPVPEVVARDGRWTVRTIRLASNTGGSGGFNAGLERVLAEGAESERADLIWLLDSDALPTRSSLRLMIEALATRPDLCGVGGEMRDTTSGVAYEIGGFTRGDTGMSRHEPSLYASILECDFVPACCLLVRRNVVARTGSFPDHFLYYDDVDWCLAAAESTGLSWGAVRGAVVYHPWWWHKFSKARRYFYSRNFVSVLDRTRASRRQRFRRAMKDVKDAASFAALGMTDWADDHLRGLTDAARGQRFGRGRFIVRPALPTRPIEALAVRLKSELEAGKVVFVHPALGDGWRGLESVNAQLSAVELQPWKFRVWHDTRLLRLLVASVRELMRYASRGPRADISVVPPGWLTSWMHADRVLVVLGHEFFEARAGVLKSMVRAAGVLLQGTWLCVRIALMRRRPFVPQQRGTA